MTTKKPITGRPPSPHRERYPVRHDAIQRDRWDLAAATCGMSLQQWIRATLDSEATRATHVPKLKAARHG